MAFDKNAFAAAFLNQLTAGMEERKEKAEEYERQQREAAARNAPLINARKLRAQEAAQLGQKAMALGAREEHVKAAMASGINGVGELYEKLMTAANEKGVRTLGEDDIEEIVNMPSIPAINQRYIDMSLREFANQQFGVGKIDRAEEPEPSGSVIRKLLGLDAMSSARRKLADTEYMDGMSIADINEAARQAEYTSLFPDLGFNLMDVKFYGPESKSTFLSEFREAATDAVTGKVAEDYISAGIFKFNQEYEQKNGKPATPAQIAEEEKELRNELVQNAVKSVIESMAAEYGRGGFFKDEATRDLISKTMGPDYLADQMAIYSRDIEEEETTTEEPTNTEQDQETQTKESTQTEAPNTEDKETQIPTEEGDEGLTEQEKYIQDVTSKYPSRPKQASLVRSKKVRDWDKLYEGKLNEDGSPIIVSPRPADGGEKTRKIPITTGLLDSPTGRFKDVTEAEYWDSMYAETHDPETGRPYLPELES
jgi:hypothetical protein